MEVLYNKILEAIRQNNACVMATVVSSIGSAPRKIGAKMVVHKDGAICGTIGGGKLEKIVIEDAISALKRRKTFLKEYPLDKKSGLQVCGGKVGIFIEVFEPKRQLIIAGAGHIGLALSFIAKLLKFSVVIVDNRHAFANTERFPHADKVICSPYKAAFKKIEIDKNSYIVIVTHGHLFDEECLGTALTTKAGYIGMIGSKAKIEHIFNALAKKGFSKRQLAAVHSPIGLDIGAETPEEIAVAIAAELIKENKKI